MELLLTFTIALGVSYMAIPVIIRVAMLKKLYDIPDERKIHAIPKASLGGLGIFAGFGLAFLLSDSFSTDSAMSYFMAASFVVFFLGLKDDILVLSPIKKLIGQVLATFIIVYKGGLRIESMHGCLGITHLPEVWSLLLTYFTILVVINAFNLIDGIDGLAGSLGCMVAIVTGIFMMIEGEMAYAAMAVALAGALLAFLRFNFQPAKIFMGDTGAMLIGLNCSILVIKLINTAEGPTTPFPIESAPAIAIAILFVPLLDTLRVFAIRAFQGRSPFSPDRNHIHHMLLDKGFSHRQIVFTLVSINLVVIAATYLCRSLGSTILIIGLNVLYFGGIGILYILTRKGKASDTEEDDVLTNIMRKTSPHPNGSIEEELVEEHM